MKGSLSSIAILVIYMIATLIITYPVVFMLTQGVPGGPMDVHEKMWLMWWYKKALINLQVSPARLVFFYYPLITYFPLATLTPLNWLISIPLETLLGPVATYNVHWLLTFALSGLAAYLLCYRLTGSKLASFVGGIIFAFYPNKIIHARGHFEQLTIYLLPIYILSLIQFWERPEPKNSIRTGLVLGFVLLVDFELVALFVLPFSAIFAVRILSNQQRLMNRKFVLSLALMLLIVISLISPFYVPFIIARFRGQLDYLYARGTVKNSADVLSFLLPSFAHPILGKIPFIREGCKAIQRSGNLAAICLYVGVVPTLLSIWGAVKDFSRARFWIAVAVIGIGLSLGPALKVGGEIHEGFIMPFTLLQKLPFYEWVRIPARMGVLIMLSLAVLAAIGLREFLKALPSPKFKVFLTAGLSLILLFEYLTLYPFPVYRYPSHPFLNKLAQDRQDYGILTLSSVYHALYLQTIHQHKMVEGFVYRWPQTGLMHVLHLHKVALSPAAKQGQGLWPGGVPPSDPLPRIEDDDIFRGIDGSPANILSSLGIRYIIFSKEYLWPENWEEIYLLQLHRNFGPPVAWNESLNIYEVKEDTSFDSTELEIGPGWYPFEYSERGFQRWMENEAELYVKGPREGSYQLRLMLPLFEGSYHLQLYVNDELVDEFSVRRAGEIITSPFKLDRERNIVRFCVPDGCKDGASECKTLPFSEVNFLTALPTSHVFEEKIRLLSYTPLEKSLKPGEVAHLTLYWRALKTMDRRFHRFYAPGRWARTYRGPG